MVHLKNIRTKETSDIYAKKLAALTPGFSGADIANVCNEAALIAARTDKETVDEQDFEAALDRIIGGLEKKNSVLSPEEKRTVAFHEAGHAVAGWFLKHCDPLLKLSIVPRGQALGYAQYMPDDRAIMSRDELFDRMCMALGGRAAEFLTFGKISTGAQDDLDKVTKMAYSQILLYGMNERVGPIAFSGERGATMGRPYSEHMAELIDEEVRVMVKQAYETTLSLLQQQISGLTQIAHLLLEKEKIRGDDLLHILGERPKKPKFGDLYKDLLPDPPPPDPTHKPEPSPPQSPAATPATGEPITGGVTAGKATSGEGTPGTGGSPTSPS
jgi:AFG3 family protein